LSGPEYNFTSINISGGHILTLNAPASGMILHINGSLTLSGGSKIAINGGPVTIYQNGTSMNASGGSFLNNSKDPKNLVIYGSAGVGSIKLSGGSTQYALIYAPTAVINFSSGTGSLFGSVIGCSVEMSGGFSVHFNENQ